MNAEELAQAIEDKKQLQVLPNLPAGSLRNYDPGEWVNASVTRALEVFGMTYHNSVRVKPDLVAVDMLVLVDSKIDCEFWDDDEPDAYSLLRQINSSSIGPYVDAFNTYHRFCRPRQDHWHSWRMGECPLPAGLIINIEYRSGEITRAGSDYADLDWQHHGNPDDHVIAFRVTGKADGYCWPWELENG